VNAPFTHRLNQHAALSEPHPAMTAEQNALMAAVAIAAAPTSAPIAANQNAITTAAAKHAMLADAESVGAFWREAGPKFWFAKDENFDRKFRARFLHAHEAAARGELFGWLTTPNGALALILLLDQFPRNAFRGTTRMYQTDATARRVAHAALALGHDQAIPPELRLFVTLPFGHSEDLADQERSVALNRPLGEETLKHALGHYDIIRRFGRFPHRNPILGREMREEEQRFLDEGGFKG
jgi:uncharacterized protein (DUF924 family)